MYGWLYHWVDRLWQWIAETVFVRFDFDLPVEHLKQLAKNSKVTFALTHVGVIEFFIISSWCRSQGLGAIQVSNRLRILLLAKPSYFFQILFRRKSYAQLFMSDNPGPRLLFCPSNERAKVFQPIPVERLLGEIYAEQAGEKPLHFVPLLILWRKHLRETSRKISEYVLGLGSDPTLMGKVWYLLWARKDSTVRALKDFPQLHKNDEMFEGSDDTPPMKLAKTTRRKILVETHKEMRVVLGPRYLSPHSVKETLLRDPEVQRVIEEVAAAEGVDKKKVMSRAYQNLTEIVSNYRYRTIEILYVLLTWLFNKISDGLSVKDEEFQRVRELAKTKSVVFVPCHRSHFDYLIIPFVLFKQDMVTPHVAAGINLAFWPAGGILRSGGAFFIRRSFRGDPLYSMCLRKYVEYLLQHRLNIKFFIEGTRSRSGKMLAPAYGMLKMVLEAQRNHVVEDAVLVPVSICYDEVPEQGAYSKELSGAQKTQESASELIKSRGVIKRNIGKVYVRLADPLYAREIQQSAQALGLDPKITLQKTAFEICKRINDVSPITPKAIVSSILLGHRLNTLSLEEILRLAQRFASYSERAGFPLSVEEVGSFKRAVEQTVRRLHKGGVLSLSEDQVPRAYSLDSRKRVLLNFYKNNSIHCFVSPSIILLALFQTLKEASPHDAAGSFKDRFGQVALNLRNLLKFEFFFSPSQVFLQELDRNAHFLLNDENWANQSVSQCLATIGTQIKSWDDFCVYMRLLGELFESYLTTLEFLKANPGFKLDKKTLQQKILKFGEARTATRYPESVSTQNYSNALLLYENLKFIRIVTQDDKKIYEFDRWDEKMEAQSGQLASYLDLMDLDIGSFLKQRGFLASREESNPRQLSYVPTSPA